MITLVIKGTTITMTRAEAVALHTELVAALWALAPSPPISESNDKGFV